MPLARVSTICGEKGLLDYSGNRIDVSDTRQQCLGGIDFDFVAVSKPSAIISCLVIDVGISAFIKAAHIS